MKLNKMFFMALVFALCANVAHADIFGGRPAQKMKATAASYTSAADYVDPGTILDGTSQILGYLGTREGAFYDFKQGEFVNYLAATIYTEPSTGIAFDIGMLNTDGVALTADYNLGALVPSQDVPVMNLLQYLYVGGGVGARFIDDSAGNKNWQAAYGFDAQFKFTF